MRRNNQLEDELRSQLKNSWVVRGQDLKEVAAAKTRRSGIQVCAVRSTRTAVTIDVAQFRVIEDVKGFSAKLEVHAFLHRKALKQRHIKIGAIRIAQRVTPRVTEGQPTGRSKGVRVVNLDAPTGNRNVATRAGIANDVGIGCRRGCAVAHTRVISGEGHSERRTCAEGHDAGVLPSSEQFALEILAAEDGYVPDITGAKIVALIESRTCAVVGWIVGVD